MSSKGWKKMPLEDCMDAIIDYRGKTPRKSSFGIPLITAKIVKDGRILEPTEFIPFEDYDERMQRGIPESGDVVITTEGPLGEVGQLDNRKFSVGQRLITLRGKKGVLDNTYLKFLLMSEYVQNQLLARQTGTTVSGIKQAELRKIDLIIPPLPTQRRIAEILSALDEKIELNRQSNATLEAIAQAIFKEWFVHFNFPGATGELVESELGMIPKGWRVGKLGEVCQNTRKSVHPKDILSDIAYVGLEHVPRKSLGLLSWGGSDEVASQKSFFQKYDILFGKLRPYFHKVCIAPVDGICSTDILVIKSKHPAFFSFCLNYLFSDELIMYVSAIADGTRMPRVDWKSISEYPIPIPPEKLLYEFNEITFAFYNTLIENNHESINLAEIRDSLLPKLMNGEIEV